MQKAHSELINHYHLAQ